MQTQLFQIFLSAFFSGFVAWLAKKRGSLTTSGAWGALIVGTAIFGFGGWRWGLLLAIFFLTSSALSHFKEDEKAAVAAEKFDKGHARDWGQVMANGGLASIIAIASALAPHPSWWLFFIGVIATVNADTWATELGTLSSRAPRLITTGRPVPPGTSGGITLFGTTMTTCGGLLIGLSAAIITPTIPFLFGITLGAISGLIGSLTDSLLGATLQAMYFDDQTGIETEKKQLAGRPTRLIRGFAWLNNDIVNLIASIIGGTAATFIPIL